MGAPKIKTEIRQEQIATAALALICRDGLMRLNVARVAREVGVVPSAIYRHYKSKDEVLETVLDLISMRLLDNVRAVRAESPHALDRLRRLLMRHVELVRHEIPIPRVLFSEEIFNGHKPRRRRVHQIFQQYLGRVAELLREGQIAGEIRSELDADILSVMFLGLVQPPAILWLMSEGEFDLVGQAQGAWTIFCNTIQTGSPSENVVSSDTAVRGQPRTGTPRIARQSRRHP